MKFIIRAVIAGLFVLALSVPVNGTPNFFAWAEGRLFGTWTIDTTPNHKGHSPAGMHAVCVNDTSDEIRLVPITPAQAYGDPATGTVALQAGDPC
jgi:hypothetical protein